MKVAVTGGLGFIGNRITAKLLEAGIRVTVFARKSDPDLFNAEFDYVECDLTKKGDWQKRIPEHDAVINLAGAGIFTRWNRTVKENIYNSRILSTSSIVEAMTVKRSKVRTFINASATGYYGLCGDDEIFESDPPGADFLSMVCASWEKEALKAAGSGIRVVLLRFGTVFGRDGGAFPLLKKNFMFMVGSRLGSGRQWFPWVHIDDATGIVIHMLSNEKMSGAYNCTAPGIVTNGDFTKVMASKSGRPQVVPFVPAFILRIILGEFGTFLVGGQKAVPGRLVKAKYKFLYPDLDSALTDLMK